MPFVSLLFFAGGVNGICSIPLVMETRRENVTNVVNPASATMRMPLTSNVTPQAAYPHLHNISKGSVGMLGLHTVEFNFTIFVTCKCCEACVTILRTSN